MLVSSDWTSESRDVFSVSNQMKIILCLSASFAQNELPVVPA